MNQEHFTWKNYFLKNKGEKNKLRDKTKHKVGKKSKMKGVCHHYPCFAKKMLKGVLQIKIKDMVNCKTEMYECIDLTSKGKIDINTE